VDGRIYRLTRLLDPSGDVPTLTAVGEELQRAERERAAIQKRQRGLTRELSALNERIARLKAQRNALKQRPARRQRARVRAEHAIHGKVVGVLESAGLVMLNVGEGDQVRAGDEFVIFRGSTYVARVRVVQVYPDMAGARILRNHLKSPIKRGDEAATKVE
jgi:hypothetical protein